MPLSCLSLPLDQFHFLNRKNQTFPQTRARRFKGADFVIKGPFIERWFRRGEMARGSHLQRQQNDACDRDDGADLTDSKVHSFIVKLWVEESGDEAGKVVWHGYVTQVPDGERRYLKRLSDVTDFIEGHLKAMGVEPDHSRFGRWLRRLISR